MNVTQLTDRLSAAVEFARVTHIEPRKQGEGQAQPIPYLAHLLGVTSLVLEMRGSETEAIAALLHDAVEDGEGLKTLAEIESQFGAEVARIVLACSDTTDPDNKGKWEDRKQQYIDDMAHKQPDELRVSLADKVHNARAIVYDLRIEGDMVWKRFNRGRDQQLWYYQSLLDEFGKRRAELGEFAAPMVDEFGRLVAAIAEESTPAGDA